MTEKDVEDIKKLLKSIRDAILLSTDIIGTTTNSLLGWTLAEKSNEYYRHNLKDLQFKLNDVIKVAVGIIGDDDVDILKSLQNPR